MQQFCTGRMTFLTSNQRHQNTEIHLHFKETEIKLGTDYVVCNCIDINASERRDVTGTVCDTLAVNMIACAAVCVCVCVCVYYAVQVDSAMKTAPTAGTETAGVKVQKCARLVCI